MTFYMPSISIARFSRHEFSQISRMPEDLIALWQETGEIEACSRDGMSFKANEVAEGSFRFPLLEYGIGPDQSGDLGCVGAKHILRLVLINHPECCSVYGPEEKVAELKRVHCTTDKLTRYLFGTDEEYSHLIVKQGEDARFEMVGQAHLESPDYESALAINLEGIARRVAEMSPRRVLRFKYSCKAGAKAIRRTLAP